MRRICLTLAVAAFVVSTAQAQQGRRPGGGGFQLTPLQMLANKSVADELKLNDEQKKKVEDVSKANREEREKLWKDAGITRDNARDKGKEIEAISKKLNEAADKKLADVLNTEQSKRFSQIKIQQMGIRAFGDDQVKKGLNLTEEQQKIAKDAAEALTKDREEIFKGIGFQDREKMAEARKKFDEKRTEAMGKIATSLSADQKKAWKEMTGEKFEIKFEQPRRPGGTGNGQPRRPRTDLN